MSQRVIVMLSILMAAFQINTFAFADEDPKVKVALNVLSQYKEAIVWVSAVQKTQMSGMGIQFGGGNERKTETLGTVIDESGLTVISYSSFDPMSMMSEFTFRSDTEEQKVEMKTNFSDVKIHLPDGTEIPAKLILKDLDLDLAFIRPEEPEEGEEELPVFKYIPLSTAPKAKILDKLILLGRLGKNLDRQPSLSFARISAVVTKPRTFYVMANVGIMGTPAFTIDGKLLGLGVIRRSKGKGISALSSSRPIIIPAEDILEISKQAGKK